MKLIFGTLLSFFFMQSVQAQGLQIKQLEVLNLEEDKGPFATLNDEIIFISGVINMNNDSIVFWQNSELIEFSDSAKMHVFENYFLPTLDSSHILVLALIEVDNSFSADSINTIFQTKFLEYYAYPFALLKEQVRVEIGDDDLLGFMVYDHRNMNKIKEIIPIKGIHLFNKYEYSLTLSSY